MSSRTIINPAFLTLTTIGLALVTGCAAFPDDESTGHGNVALASTECDADDTNCSPGGEEPTCDPDDDACQNDCAPDDAACQPPCAAGDTNCNPGSAECAPMAVETAGDCDLFWGYAWNGATCDGLSGCECKGVCDGLYQSREACLEAYAGCIEPPAPDCNVLAAELATRLRAAQECNLAAMGPFVCRTFVPTIGCAEPVASADSETTKAYLETFEIYAQHCPLTDPPCQDPATLPTACVQSADVDSLVGGCVIVDDGTAPDDGDA